MDDAAAIPPTPAAATVADSTVVAAFTAPAATDAALPEEDFFHLATLGAAAAG